MAIFSRGIPAIDLDQVAQTMADELNVGHNPNTEPVPTGILAEDINYVRGKLIDLEDFKTRVEKIIAEAQDKLAEITTSIAGYNAALHVMVANETALPSRADGGANIVMTHVNIAGALNNEPDPLDELEAAFNNAHDEITAKHEKIMKAAAKAGQ